jgi:uncharacterized repeat protein (TIGR01451 family)
VKAGTGNQSDRPLLWMVVEGSSSASPSGAKTDAAASLASNVKNSAKPHLIIVTTADKQSTQPADTVTYTLVCVNVGLGSAADVVLKNPIPDGTRYIESSAAGQGTDISVERESKPAPQQGAATVVQWKLNEPLQPGAEKIVSFKVIVR